MPQHSAEASPRARAGAAQQEHTRAQQSTQELRRATVPSGVQRTALWASLKPLCLPAHTTSHHHLQPRDSQADWDMDLLCLQGWASWRPSGEPERPRTLCRWVDTQRHRPAEARTQQSSAGVCHCSTSAWHSHKCSQNLGRQMCCSTKVMVQGAWEQILGLIPTSTSPREPPSPWEPSCWLPHCNYILAVYDYLLSPAFPSKPCFPTMFVNPSHTELQAASAIWLNHPLSVAILGLQSTQHAQGVGAMALMPTPVSTQRRKTSSDLHPKQQRNGGCQVSR